MRLVVTFSKFVAACVLAGLVLSLLFLPGVIAFGQSVKTGIHDFDSLQVDTDNLLKVKTPLPIQVLDSEGSPIAQFFSENRDPLTDYQELPQNLIDALISTEDTRFFSHKGIDDIGIVRSLVSNLTGGQRQGASTITMQLVDNLRQTDARAKGETENENTLTQKVSEIKLAVEIEKKLTKQEILLAYLNSVYFGSHIYGIKTAAKQYFGVEVKDLQVEQSALLVGLLKGPEYYSPTMHPNRAKLRRDTVLERMGETKKLKDVKHYQDLPLNVLTPKVTPKQEDCSQSPYPYYCEAVRLELLSDPRYGKDENARAMNFRIGGMTIQTGLNPYVLQKLEAGLQGWNYAQPWKASTAIVSPSTGLVQGLAQTTTWEQTQIPLTMSATQSGSTFKPFVLAYALSKGLNPEEKIYSPNGYKSSVLSSPKNGFSSLSRTGNLNAREAIKYSNNVYFVKLTERYGVAPTADFLRTLFPSIPPLLGNEGSFALGVYPVSPIELSSAYAMFANGGIYCKPHTIQKIDGKPVEPDCERLISPNVAWEMNKILSAPFEGGGTLAKLGHPIAQLNGKSGSTSGWVTGTLAMYTPTLSGATFVYDPQQPTNNPLSKGVNVYGRKLFGLASGTMTAGEVLKRQLYPIITENPQGEFPKVEDSPDIIEKAPLPDLIGLQKDTALQVARNYGVELKIEYVKCPYQGAVTSLEGNILKVCAATQ